MTLENPIATEFPSDLRAIQRLRLADSVFAEICNDLELLGRELDLFSQMDHSREQGAFRDAQESYQALLRELITYFRRENHPSDRGLLSKNKR